MKITLLLWCASAFLIMLMTVYFLDVQVNTQTAIYQSGAMLIAEYFFLLLACQRICGDLLNLATLFFIVTGITNVFAAGLFASGLVPNTAASIVTLISQTPPQYFVYANILIGIALFSLLLGIRTAVLPRKIYPYNKPFLNTTATKFAGLTILLLSMPGFIATFTYDAHLFLSGGYSNLFNKSIGDSDGSLSVWYLQLANLLPICGYFILCGTKDNEKRLKKLGFGVLILSAVSSIILGMRSGFIAPVIAFFWLRKIQGRKGSERFIFAAGLLLVLITPFFVFWRIGNTGTSAHSSIVLDIFSGLNDLGTSYYYIPVVMENFPSRLGYIHFDPIISAVADCIPNVGGLNSHHAGVNRNIVYWLGTNYFVNFTTKTATIETGYSFLAEAYQSFGFIGVIPMMFIIGYVLGKLTVLSETTRSAYKIAFYASIFGCILFYTRDSFSNLLRPIVWYSGPFIFLSIFLNRYRTSSLSRNISPSIEFDSAVTKSNNQLLIP